MPLNAKQYDRLRPYLMEIKRTIEMGQTITAAQAPQPTIREVLGELGYPPYGNCGGCAMMLYGDIYYLITEYEKTL